MQLEELAKKKIAIYGLARETRAFLNFIKRNNLSFQYDLLNDNDSIFDFETLLKPERILVGAQIKDEIKKYDLIIRSPGVSIYNPYLSKAKSLGVQVLTANQLWWDLYQPKNIIAITGTKGKSTTSSLVRHFLEALGFRVALAGNIGQPVFSVDYKDNYDYWVLELSSYQLADLDFSPKVAAIVNLYPEHLDWHSGISNYYGDKLNILKSSSSIRVLSKQAIDTINALKSPVNLENVIEPRDLNIPEEELHHSFRGKHNLQNINLAATIIDSLGLDLNACLKSLKDFRSLEHRQELVAKKGKQEFINDSISTIPQTVVAAIERYKDRPVVLIFGGKDRGLDWTQLAEYLKSSVKTAIGISETGAKIRDLLKRDCHFAQNLEEALQLAIKEADENSVILFSPGAPSALPYNNFEERGRHFKDLVSKVND